MKVTIFGASGRVGQQVVRLLLAEGHGVTVFLHRHNPFENMSAVRTVRGELTNAAAVGAALAGCDAVISSLGSWHSNSKDILTQGMKTIVPQLQKSPSKRLISLTGAGALLDSDRTTLFDRLNHSLLARAAPKILTDGEEHLRLLVSSGLDWTCLRSPIMTNANQEKYILKNKLASPFATIPRAAIIRCLVDQLEDSHFLQQAPIIYRS